MSYEHLRIVCLWYRDENRTRMIHGLAGVFGLDPATLDAADGVPLPLNGGRDQRRLPLRPRFPHPRAERRQRQAYAHITSPQERAGHPRRRISENGVRAAGGEEEEPEPAERAPPRVQGRLREDEDAKHQARRTLARLGIVSQNSQPSGRHPRRSRSDGKQADHQVILSLLDLCRSLGIIDRRHRPGDGRSGSARTRRIVARCGRPSPEPPGQRPQGQDLHHRQRPQTTLRHGRGLDTARLELHRPRVAALPPGTGCLPRRRVSDRQDNRVRRRQPGLQEGRQADRPGPVRACRRLPRRHALHRHRRRRRHAPACGWGCTTSRPGEQAQPGGAWLPASTLAARQRPLAVIRINKDMDEVPRPSRSATSAATARRCAPTRSPTCCPRSARLRQPQLVLGRVPNNFDSTGRAAWARPVRAGPPAIVPTDPTRKDEVQLVQHDRDSRSTRSSPPTPARTTATTRTIEPQALALAAARLCHQPLASANRTRYPVPLHSAQQMDLDHPQYRRTALKDDQTATEVGETNGTQDDAAPDEQL